MLATWLRNYWQVVDARENRPECTGCWRIRGLRKSTFFKGHHARATTALARSTCLVACTPEHDETILGYVVFERTAACDVLHWVYVKSEMRGFGIGSALLEQAKMSDCRYTHRTPDIERLRQAKWPNMLFDPYAF